MNQKAYPITRDAAKIFPPSPENMVKYKTSYKDLESKAIFATGLYTGFLVKYLQNSNNNSFLGEADSIGPELTDMLSSLKDKMMDFCGQHINIHSSWINIDYSNKEVLVYTVLKKLDFDLEYRIFQELYIDLPVAIEDYYINPMVTVLNGAEIEAKVPLGSTQIYPE